MSRIELAHGAGGTAMGRLIKETILPSLKKRSVPGGVGLDELDDGGSIPYGDIDIVISTDGHTVDPIFFPGGDLGRLSISGTVNDIAVMGARPVAITCALIIEEGFPLDDLNRILKSMNDTSEEAGVPIISGDTKVMPHGHIDKIVAATTGVGIVEHGKIIRDTGVKPGNKIIITGTIGDHGVALLAAREGISFETELKSDVAPIWNIIEKVLRIGGVTAMKDPTRGGLASALNDIAKKSKTTIYIDEDELPIRREVVAASEMLGIDPLEVTCEGRAIIAIESDRVEEALEAIRKTRYGENARIIGEVKNDKPGFVIMNTSVGGKRIVETPYGEPIPRVC
ncbi:MAG: hydrogenase expression/formation protein HypE [Candidatus Freyrarchaeum guaymaensis]